MIAWEYQPELWTANKMSKHSRILLSATFLRWPLLSSHQVKKINYNVLNNIQILHDKTRCMTINLMSSSQLDLFMKTVDLNPTDCLITTFKSTDRLMFYCHTLVLQMLIIIADNRSHHDCRGVGLCLILSNLSYDGGRCSDTSFFCMHQASSRSPRHLDRPSTWRRN